MNRYTSVSTLKNMGICGNMCAYIDISNLELKIHYFFCYSLLFGQ